jgi:hypothetical protein
VITFLTGLDALDADTNPPIDLIEIAARSM